MGNRLDINTMLTIDDNGMPTAPSLTQLLDKDIQELYRRDKSKDKHKYLQDAIVIYYLGDPKSPARQSGLSDIECLKMAIEQAGLPKEYIPDELVRKLITRYYKENIGEAGRVVENILKSLHLINIAIDAIANILHERISSGLTAENAKEILGLIDDVNEKAGQIPSIVKKLNEARENLMYEKETELSRGGGIVSSSMDAENYQ